MIDNAFSLAVAPTLTKVSETALDDSVVGNVAANTVAPRSGPGVTTRAQAQKFNVSAALGDQSASVPSYKEMVVNKQTVSIEGLGIRAPSRPRPTGVTVLSVDQPQHTVGAPEPTGAPTNIPMVAPYDSTFPSAVIRKPRPTGVTVLSVDHPQDAVGAPEPVGAPTHMPTGAPSSYIDPRVPNTIPMGTLSSNTDPALPVSGVSNTISNRSTDVI